ncbi:MarR family transcriptional regulator [Paenibacillus sp. Marseille-Q9583]
MANVFNLHKSTMSRTINALEENEWIERITDPENRRYEKLHRFTPLDMII